jgi:hypothetical protein
MPSALDAFQDFKRTVFANIDLIHSLKLVCNSETLTNQLKRNPRAARCRLPPSKQKQPPAIEPWQRNNDVGQRSRSRMRIRKTADRPVNGN